MRAFSPVHRDLEDGRARGRRRVIRQRFEALVGVFGGGDGGRGLGGVLPDQVLRAGGAQYGCVYN